jgi:hypothetical protein
MWGWGALSIAVGFSELQLASANGMWLNHFLGFSPTFSENKKLPPQITYFNPYT